MVIKYSINLSEIFKFSLCDKEECYSYRYNNKENYWAVGFNHHLSDDSFLLQLSLIESCSSKKYSIRDKILYFNPCIVITYKNSVEERIYYKNLDVAEHNYIKLNESLELNNFKFITIT